jgi:nitroimidazol reductase NimA-like FMN-containing flavoprotein (pyridoxamine 5'-phosphate oxidase superfamily)
LPISNSIPKLGTVAAVFYCVLPMNFALHNASFKPYYFFITANSRKLAFFESRRVGLGGKM